jgi:hypothetical protein
MRQSQLTVTSFVLGQLQVLLDAAFFPTKCAFRAPKRLRSQSESISSEVGDIDSRWLKSQSLKAKSLALF